MSLLMDWVVREKAEVSTVSKARKENKSGWLWGWGKTSQTTVRFLSKFIRTEHNLNKASPWTCDRTCWQNPRSQRAPSWTETVAVQASAPGRGSLRQSFCWCCSSSAPWNCTGCLRLCRKNWQTFRITAPNMHFSKNNSFVLGTHPLLSSVHISSWRWIFSRISEWSWQKCQTSSPSSPQAGKATEEPAWGRRLPLSFTAKYISFFTLYYTIQVLSSFCVLIWTFLCNMKCCRQKRKGTLFEVFQTIIHADQYQGEEEAFRPLRLQPLGGCVQHWHIITF